MEDNEANNNNMDVEEWEEPPDAVFEEPVDEPVEPVEEGDQDGIPRNADGTMDGGLAGITDSTKEPDLVGFKIRPVQCSMFST
jgi:hypothetical protein